MHYWKKYLSLFLLNMILIAGVFSLPSAYALTISIPDNLSEMPGEQIAVPVQIDQQILADAYNFTIQYDPAILEVQRINYSGGILVWSTSGNSIFLAFMSMTEIVLDEKLFEINFLVKTVGECALTPIVVDYVYDDLYQAQVIPGFFRNIIDPEYTLSVSKAGTGQGMISSSPEGINCGVDCNETYIEDTVVTLTAVPEESSYFDGWSGGGCALETECEITMTIDASITATFTLKTYTITAAAGPNGAISPDEQISLGYGADQTYTIQPDTGYHIADVRVDGQSVGAVFIYKFSNITENHTIEATFALNTYTLTINQAGEGKGKVISYPSGLDCGDDCTENYSHGTLVTLTAYPEDGSVFQSWTGLECSDFQICEVLMDKAVTITAFFAPITISIPTDLTGNPTDSIEVPIAIDQAIPLHVYALSVEFDPNVLELEGITYGEEKGVGFSGQLFTEDGSQFQWSVEEYLIVDFLNSGSIIANGELFSLNFSVKREGQGELILSLPEIGENDLLGVQFISGYFKTGYTLSVSKGGTGSGRVVSDPEGIDCGVDCAEIYESGATVTLTAIPETDSIFSGWSGAGCTGTGPCEIAVDATTFVSSAFSKKTYTIKVSTGPHGSASPSGQLSVIHGEDQTITITPDPGYHIKQVVVDGASIGAVNRYTFSEVTENHEIAVTFAINYHALEITLTGTGLGTVVSAPEGITCGSACMATYPHGTLVSLTALADDSSIFSGWQGYCQGSELCQITMNSDAAVTASFTKKSFTISAGAEGQGTIFPSGDIILDYGQSQSFTITPDEGYYLSGLFIDGLSVEAVSTYTFSNVTAYHTIQAVFELIPALGVTLSIPSDLWGQVNDIIKIPVQVDQEFTAHAYRLFLWYDPNVLEFQSITYGQETWDKEEKQGISQDGSQISWNENAHKLDIHFENEEGAIVEEKLFDLNFKVIRDGQSDLLLTIPQYNGNDLFGAELLSGAFNKVIVSEDTIPNIGKMDPKDLQKGGVIETIIGNPDDPKTMGEVSNLIKNQVTLKVDIRSASPIYFLDAQGNTLPSDSSLTVKVAYETDKRENRFNDPNSIVVSIKFYDAEGNEVEYNPNDDPEAPPIIIEVPLHPDLQDLEEDQNGILNRLVTQYEHEKDPNRYRIRFIRGNQPPETFIPREDRGESIYPEQRNGVWIAVIYTTHASDWESEKNTVSTTSSDDSTDSGCFLSTL